MPQFAKALLAGAIGVVLAASWSKGIEWGPSSWVAFVGVLGGVAIFASWKSATLVWTTPVGLFAGIALGVFVNAVLDFAFRDIDHNLFPFEIVLFWIVAGPPVGFGIAFGQWLRHRRTPTGRW